MLIRTRKIEPDEEGFTQTVWDIQPQELRAAAGQMRQISGEETETTQVWQLEHPVDVFGIDGIEVL